MDVNLFQIAGVIGLSLLIGAIVFLYVFFLRRPRRPEATEVSITRGELNIKGVRYENEGGEPIILVHGYAGNSINFQSMGYKLYEMGFDVWMPNLRGHGLGMQRSISNAEDYHFDSMVTEDIPAIVDQVFEETGKRAVLVGHSMGGMAVKAYVAGVHFDEHGKFVVDEDLAQTIAKEKLHSVVLIGSPFSFDQVPVYVKWYTRVLPSLPKFVQTVVISEKGPSRKTLMGKVRGKLIEKMDNLMGEGDIFRGIVNPDNFDREKSELIQLFERGVSPVPKDLIKDVRHWAKSGRVESEKGFQFLLVRKVFLPMLFIAGECDKLGPSEDIKEEAKLYATKTHVRTILVRNTSHVDLIAGERAAKLVGGVVGQFAKNPSSLGSPGIYREIG